MNRILVTSEGDGVVHHAVYYPFSSVPKQVNNPTAYGWLPLELSSCPDALARNWRHQYNQSETKCCHALGYVVAFYDG